MSISSLFILPWIRIHWVQWIMFVCECICLYEKCTLQWTTSEAHSLEKQIDPKTNAIKSVNLMWNHLKCLLWNGCDASATVIVDCSQAFQFSFIYLNFNCTTQHCTTYRQFNGKLDRIHEFHRVKIGKSTVNFRLVFFVRDQLEAIREIDRFTRYTRHSATIFGHDLCHFPLLLLLTLSVFYLFVCWEWKINVASPLNPTRNHLNTLTAFAHSNVNFYTHLQKWNNIEFNICDFLLWIS